MRFLRKKEENPKPITYAYIHELIKDYEFTERDYLSRVYRAWRNSTAIKLPFSIAKTFLIRTKEIESKINNAVKTLEDNFYEGIYAIRAFRHIYGTGKSQIAIFLSYELESKVDSIKNYVVLDPHNMDELREELTQILNYKSDKYRFVFIDEVDLLVDPDLDQREQAKLIEKFANIIIGFSEKAKAKDIPLAIFLILSAKVDELINNLSKDRLGRRLSYTLIEADIIPDKRDLEELAAKIFALLWSLDAGGIREKIDNEPLFFNLIDNLIRDLAEKLYDPAQLNKLSIGVIISRFLELFELIFKHLDEDNWKSNAQKIIGDDRSYLGRQIEKVIKEYIETHLSYFRFEIDSTRIETKFYPKPLEINNRLSDGYYSFSIGTGKIIGTAPIEITLTEDLSAKKNQIYSFTSSYPTLLILGIRKLDENHLKSIKELTDETDYELFPIIFNEDLAKYALLLHRDKAVEFIRKVSDFDNNVEAFLKKLAINYYNIWFSTNVSPAPIQRKEEKIIQEEPHKQKKLVSIIDIKERLIKGLIGELGSIGLDTKSKKKISSLEKSFRKTINNTLQAMKLKQFDYSEIKGILNDVILQWIQNGLGRRTDQYFYPYNKASGKANPTWSNDKAAEIVVKEILPRIIDKNKTLIDTTTI